MKPLATFSKHGVLTSLAAVLLVSATRAAEPLPRLTPSTGGGYNVNYGGHASTLAEGVLRGEAELRRAQGEQALNNARALRSFEAAVDQALDNKVKRLAVRQQRQLMARTHRAEIERLRTAKLSEAREARLQEKSEAEAALTPEERAEKFERLASDKLSLARKLAEQGHTAKSQEWLQQIVQQYPGTAAAREVGMLLADK